MQRWQYLRDNERTNLKKEQIRSLIYLTNIYYQLPMPNTILCIGDRAENKTNKNPAPIELTF